MKKSIVDFNPDGMFVKAVAEGATDVAIYLLENGAKCEQFHTIYRGDVNFRLLKAALSHGIIPDLYIFLDYIELYLADMLKYAVSENILTDTIVNRLIKKFMRSRNFDCLRVIAPEMGI
jgi:hypothetical protein